MRNRIVSVFFVIIALCRSAAAFEANVSKTVIPEGESFQLYLRQDGNGAAPDISVLNTENRPELSVCLPIHPNSNDALSLICSKCQILYWVTQL